MKNKKVLMIVCLTEVSSVKVLLSGRWIWPSSLNRYVVLFFIFNLRGLKKRTRKVWQNKNFQEIFWWCLLTLKLSSLTWKSWSYVKNFDSVAAHLSRIGSRRVKLNTSFGSIEFKSNHMGLLFYENEKHSPGSFAKISILKKFI